MGDAFAETRACTFTLDPRGFVRATMRHGVEMEGTDAREALVATHRVAEGRRLPVLVDTRGIKRQSREAREAFASPEAAVMMESVALLIGSPVSRVIANFFLRSHSHLSPTQAFTDEAAAIAWLLSRPQ